MIMTRSRAEFEPGRLWDQLRACTDQAIASGDLQSIETQATRIEQSGVRFLVRVADNLRRKADQARARPEPTKNRPKDYNPFLPPEKKLTVAGVSDSHIAVLNKFNVVDHHLLIVTRHFEPQDTLLGLRDFEALWLCLQEYPSLGFYNGGKQAGASQNHKHLQLVPLPMTRDGPALPIEPVLPTIPTLSPGRIPAFSFRHSFTRLPAGLAGYPSEAAHLSLGLYHRMLESVQKHRLDTDGKTHQSAPYNLLLTPQWMMLVARSIESADGIAINALAYAGSLFVHNNEDLNRVKILGPMHFLNAVGQSAF